jgi:hypothetical protein
VKKKKKKKKHKKMMMMMMMMKKPILLAVFPFLFFLSWTMGRIQKPKSVRRNIYLTLVVHLSKATNREMRT